MIIQLPSGKLTSWMENPHYEWEIHLQVVHFPASNVSLPECNMFFQNLNFLAFRQPYGRHFSTVFFPTSQTGGSGWFRTRTVGYVIGKFPIIPYIHSLKLIVRPCKILQNRPGPKRKRSYSVFQPSRLSGCEK